jgi:hypothetical protein
MKRRSTLALVGVLAAAAAIVAVVQSLPREGAPQPAPRPPKAPGTTTERQKAAEPAGQQVPQGSPIGFTSDGMAGEIAGLVGRVVRPGPARVAISHRDGGRWVCIIADSGVPERYCELDRGMTLDDVPALKDAGFVPPPSHIARTSTSIYRSYAKRAMQYDPERGDRILILLCPESAWPTLDLRWPAQEASLK